MTERCFTATICCFTCDRALCHRYYLMYLDAAINDDGVLAEELQNVLHLTALRFVAYMRRLPDQTAVARSNHFFYGRTCVDKSA